MLKCDILLPHGHTVFAAEVGIATSLLLTQGFSQKIYQRQLKTAGPRCGCSLSDAETGGKWEEHGRAYNLVVYLHLANQALAFLPDLGRCSSHAEDLPAEKSSRRDRHSLSPPFFFLNFPISFTFVAANARWLGIGSWA